MSSISTSKLETDIILNRANVGLARSQRLVASWLPRKTGTNEEEPSTTSKTEEELQREEDEIFVAVPERLGLGAPIPKNNGFTIDGSSGNATRTAESSSNEKLRRQLLGRNYEKITMMKEKEKKAEQQQRLQQLNKSAPSTEHNDDEEDGDHDDDEDGRTAMIGRTKKKDMGSGASISQSLRKKKKKQKKKEGEEGQDLVPFKAEGTIGSLEDIQPDKHEGDAADHHQKRDGDLDGNITRSAGQDGDIVDTDGTTTGTVSTTKKSKRTNATSFLDEILAERAKKRKKKKNQQA